jgi:cellulose synthase/poly-beta-1,6-N-acetylglucosamine synthase-like glycosyltransferase
MNDSVKITIGMCVKNSEDIVKKAINSILDQDFPKDLTELIIVDGKSKDKTLKILKTSLSNSDLKVRVYSESSGLGVARQMVVENARGTYIVWVDADMILPPSYVSNLVSFMDSHSSVGIAAGKYAVYMGQGVAADLENIVYAVDSVYGEKSASKFGYLPGTEGSIFRVEAIREIGGFDVRMNGAAEDTEVAYRMNQSGWKVVKTKEVFAESTRQSWSSLWKQYVWYGRGGHFIFHKNSGSVNLLKMTPFAGFLAGLLRFPQAYRLTNKKAVVLLPVHYTYKRVAWFFGFISAHGDGYGHFKNSNN